VIVVASVAYLGHATTLIKVDGTRILTDPVLRRRVAHLRRRTPVDLKLLGHVDVVVISHVHNDHLDRPSLGLLGTDAVVVAPRGAGRLLRRFSDVREVGIGDELEVDGVSIQATPAFHRSWRPTVWGTEAMGFLFSGSRRVYFAGDTGLFEGMSSLADAIDLALLPVAGWGRRLGPRHLDPRSAAEALALLRPRVAVPIHWGTLSTPGRMASSDPPEAFRRHARELAADVEVRILAPGESTTF
jgi:L-ascorbate metabolism protein UlaG (beta-lactamase superfamily)